MSRRLSACLVLLRLFQLLAALVPGAMNGWLTEHLYANKLGPSVLVLVVEILVVFVFVYSTLALVILHTHQRSRRTVFLICTICLDVVFCFVDITILSLLSFSGLPSNCSGLTTSIWSKGDKADLPSRGYSTIRFSNEQDGHRGELDKYCSMERGFYFCTVLTILAFVISMILSVMRFFENNYTRNSEIQYLLDEREEILKLELKAQEHELRAYPNAILPSSGAIMPTSHFTADEEAAIEASILASLGRTPATAPYSSAAPPPPPSLQAPSNSRYPSANLPSIPEASARGGSFSSSSSSIQTAEAVSPSSTMSILNPVPSASSSLPLDTDEDDDVLSEMDANMAMVSDGSRYGGQTLTQLPPYSPGTHRTMDGHGDESNELRLSEYVKGETRAQNMKDGGSYQ
ncbi:hypothetical protein BD289DRAFT_168201 [Coniella lustricola]|uniref:MARVEL domain-containing protein n=1 Tax=Coniella lustricola TaxID=2025994 RepID=A0A2T2ZU49_9PEZI|nr:hypothetical protein BD289DRAFT_168201 [Coniella lustricola]